MRERYSGEESERIALWFIPTKRPEGGAPEVIRDQWIDVPLPIRESNVANEQDTIGGYKVGADIFDPTDVKVREVMDAVPVKCADAFKALRVNGRDEAAEWWGTWFNSKDWMFGSTLIFQSSEGRTITPEEIRQEFPEMENFDEIEVDS